MTTRLLSLIALTLLAPLTAQAQAGGGLGSPVTPVVPAGYGVVLVPAAPSAELTLRDQAEAEPASGPSFGRSWGHSWLGFGIGTGAGAIVGGVVAALACDSSSDFNPCGLWSLVGAGVGALTVAPFGSALSVWGFGENNGGTGNFFAALGGAYLGTGLGLGLTAVLSAAGQPQWGAIFGPIIGVFATTLGSAAGYQLSSHGPREGGSSASIEPIVVPTLTPVENGATVGVAGIF